MELDVYILILKFLENSPYKEEAQSIASKLVPFLPNRIDFLGRRHPQTLNEFLHQHPNIRDDTLPSMLQRLRELVNQKIPPVVRGSLSLLGNGRQSLLRNEHMLHNQHENTCIKALNARRYFNRNNAVINIMHSIRARTHLGHMPVTQMLSSQFHQRPVRYRRLLGHLSAVYCVTFDCTGKFIFTGADDSLIKIWSAIDGRLLATLRGHSGEITDLGVNYENTLLASGSVDRFIRIWDLQTTKMLHCLNAHNAMITSVKFSPFNRFDRKHRYLISTGNDGFVCFWKYDPLTNEFKKPRKLNERIKPSGQMVCSSFTNGGTFLAIGSTDNYVKIFGFFNCEWPWSSIDVELHSDHVDSLQFSHQGYRLVSGSKDGTALIWTFSCQEWKTKTLNMRETLTKESADLNDDKMSVCMVGWSLDDVYVVASVSNFLIKVWNSTTGTLVHELMGHKDVVYCIENHPVDPRIVLTGGHDGLIILWDIQKGTCIKQFYNLIDGQGHAAVLDVKFSPDGQMFAATDTHGNLSLYGYSQSDIYDAIPDQVFFQTDYRPLIRDINNFVLDEQTHLAPHLMAAAPLIDQDGNPHPERYQRLVPEANRPAGSLRNVVQPLKFAELQERQRDLDEIMELEETSFRAENAKTKKPPENLLGPKSSRDTPRLSRQTARMSTSGITRRDNQRHNRQMARRTRPLPQPPAREIESDHESWNSPTDESDDSDYAQPRRRRPRRAARRAQRINLRIAERLNYEEEPGPSSMPPAPRHQAAQDDYQRERDSESTETDSEGTEVDEDNEATEIDESSRVEERREVRQSLRIRTRRQNPQRRQSIEEDSGNEHYRHRSRRRTIRKRSRSSSRRVISSRRDMSRRSGDSHELRPRSKRKKTRYCSGCLGDCSRHRS